MEAELVNAFVEKQRDVINDLMARNVLSEARLAVAEKQLQKMNELSQRLSEEQTKVELLSQQNNAMNEVIERSKQDLDFEKARNENLQDVVNKSAATITELQQTVNHLTLEKEAQRVKAEKIKKRAQELASDESK